MGEKQGITQQKQRLLDRIANELQETAEQVYAANREETRSHGERIDWTTKKIEQALHLPEKEERWIRITAREFLEYVMQYCALKSLSLTPECEEGPRNELLECAVNNIARGEREEEDLLADSINQNEEKILFQVRQKVGKTGVQREEVEDTAQFLAEYHLIEKIVSAEFDAYRKTRIKSKNAPGYSSAVMGFANAQSIREHYEIGIALAKGGVYTGFMFHLAGLPIMHVEMKRRGLGATWKPYPDFDGSQLKGKHVLLCENDVMTGKTLRSAYGQLQQYEPAGVSVCFWTGPSKFCRVDFVPAGIERMHHLTDEITNAQRFRTTRTLLELFDPKYNLIRKDTQ